MKKILSLVLSACMMLSAAALAEGTFTPADSYDVGERVYNAGTVTLEKSEGSAQTVSTDQYVGEAGKDYTDEKVYTYNSYTPGINSSLNCTRRTHQTVTQRPFSPSSFPARRKRWGRRRLDYFRVLTRTDSPWGTGEPSAGYRQCLQRRGT